MTDTLTELIINFTELSFPITRMRIGKTHQSIKTKGNFKRVVKCWDGVYQISNDEQKYVAMHYLSIILSRTFNIPHSETIPILKKHLHIK